MRRSARLNREHVFDDKCPVVANTAAMSASSICTANNFAGKLGSKPAVLIAVFQKLVVPFPIAV